MNIPALKDDELKDIIESAKENAFSLNEEIPASKVTLEKIVPDEKTGLDYNFRLVLSYQGKKKAADVTRDAKENQIFYKPYK